jgi:AraC family transcriptional regulator of adaptative response/methylated-DNA-[protein]-cysteine methyltransferase
MNLGTDNRQAPSAAAEQDARWQAIVNRDASAQGTFVYAVRTTGVYCRPGCPSRIARRQNVSFFATCEQAEAAGYRPCRRCHPDAASPAQRDAAMVREACRLIETAEEAPKLDKLAASFGLSPFHFHRRFKAVTGLTPKAWGAAHRARKVRVALADASTSVTQAIYGAGFNSNSRFYEKSGEVLGMTPTAFRSGGRSACIRFAVGECSLGAILVACSDKGVCAILLGDDPDALVRELQDRFPNADLVGGDAGFEALVSQVVGFVDAPGIGLDLPLDLRGTAFQQRVWQALRDIPAGRTVSYTELARRIGAPRSVRAVGQACGANPIAVAIPCHRVVRHDGALAGYRWGVERKRALLEKESAAR